MAVLFLVIFVLLLLFFFSSPVFLLSTLFLFCMLFPFFIACPFLGGIKEGPINLINTDINTKWLDLNLKKNGSSRLSFTFAEAVDIGMVTVALFMCMHIWVIVDQLFDRYSWFYSWFSLLF